MKQPHKSKCYIMTITNFAKKVILLLIIGDYRELQGEWIPFRKLGYSTLEELFQDVPGFKVFNVNGEWVVDAVASQETQHIATMVARQKSTKRPPAKLNYSVCIPGYTFNCLYKVSVSLKLIIRNNVLFMSNIIK